MTAEQLLMSGAVLALGLDAAWFANRFAANFGRRRDDR